MCRNRTVVDEAQKNRKDSKMVNWNFPGNQDGQIKGVADAGIENFNGTELSSLARENCQNSLDAALDDSNPNVLVEFENYFVSTNQIPGIIEYRNILKKCKKFWDRSKSEKAKIFLRDAIKEAEKEKNFVLRISDYNTTGLSEPYAKSDDPFDFSFDGWNALIKIDGGANKGDDKAGAFGIGKSAPFSNSHYRLVFYRTYNKKYERAAQGISRLMSYQDCALMTSGIGYYGEIEGNNPVEAIQELDSINRRTEIGTDIFIYGFKSANLWETEITVALLESFLMSFFNGHLRVKIQGREINKKTLAAYMERIHKERPGATKGTYGNYLALTRTKGVHTYSQEFHGMGILELRLLVDPNEKLDRKVLIVRKAGMKLFRLGNISKLVSFTGILELKGRDLNSYFRTMETVTHDNWEPGRHQNPKQAKAYYEEIKEWIRNIVAELAEHTCDDEMDVEGLGGVLQKESEVIESGNSDDKRENINDCLENIEVLERPSKVPSKGFFYGKGNEGSSQSTNIRGTLGKTGDSGLRILKGKRKRKKIDSHRGISDSDGRDIVVQKKSGGENSCPLKNVRIIKNGVGMYSLNFEIPHDVKYGRIELVTVGENGKSNRLRMINVKPVLGCEETKLNGDVIEIVNMVSHEKIKLIVSLADLHDYAMEVNVYEYN